MEKYVIQEENLSQDIISQIVAIHRKEIGQGFLSSLGDKALELIFSLANESNSGILLAVIDTTKRDRVGGFLLGTLSTNKFFKDFLFKKSIAAVFWLTPKLLSFAKLRKVSEALLYPAKGAGVDMPKAELLDIAILNDYYGTGTAQMLFHRFSSILVRNGIEEFKITTGENLKRAQRFYEKLGAKKKSSIEIHRGENTFVYVYKINENLEVNKDSEEK